ncbi:cupin domain-containing protein [Caproiciproducens sp.]
MHKRTVGQPWGAEIWIAHNEHYTVRELHMNKGAAVSLQYHKVKTETLYILSGRAEHTIGPSEGELAVEIVGPGDVINHKPMQVHRMRALEDLCFIEVSTPEIEDIVRLQDEYGRADG